MLVERRVAGILLAAGAGSRLGQPKATVEIGGEPLAGRGVALLRDGGALPVVVVTGAIAVDLPGVLIVHNPDWRTGMGSSLAAGLAPVPDDSRRCRDRPGRSAARRRMAVRRLIAAYRAGACVAVAAYGGALRNPVLLSRTLACGHRARRRRRRRPAVPARAPGVCDAGGVRRHRQRRRRGHQG
jgi:nicotine blue oxidoreductase